VTPPPHDVDAAPVAMLVDVGSGRTLYAKDADKPFLPASVTKTMTAFVAFRMLAEGKLRPEQTVTVSDDAYRHWHNTGSRMFLERGQQISIDALLLGIMTDSANDGCIVLAEGVTGSVSNWVARMNAEAQALGMTESHFGTPNGWMDNGNTYVSARDMLILAQAMLNRYPQYYHRYVGHPEMTWNGITQHNHDPTLGIVPGADGIKTGFTGEAHYNFLGSAQRGGRRLVMMLAGVPTPRERARAAKALLEWGFAAWDVRPLFAAEQKVGAASVQGGASGSVPLVAPRAYYVTDPLGRSAPIQMHMIYQSPLPAPVARGQQVAELEVRVGSGTAWRVPLVAANAVARGNWLDRLREGLRRLFE